MNSKIYLDFSTVHSGPAKRDAEISLNPIQVEIAE